MGLFHYSLDQVPQLDTLTFLEASQSFLMSHSAYKKECFHYDELEILETSVRWKGVEAKKVVFCEGAQGVNNPIFQDLEFENAFGDIVDLVSSDIPEKIILNHGKWCCPLEKKGCFRYGSTSYWEDTEDNRKEGVEDLKNRLNRFLKVSYRIEKIHHGVRPVLKDRSPFAGPHPKYSHLFMINGMGGQGCSKAPLVISKFLNAGYLD